MKVGDVVTVYRRRDTREERCECCGEKRFVPWYEVKRIRVIKVKSEQVADLYYGHPAQGFGDVLYAVDAQGRTYRKQPHWDGPRASLWLRRPIVDPWGLAGIGFDQYPTHKFSRDLFGRPIKELLPA